MFETVKIQPGVSEQFRDVFKIKVQAMSEQSKLCAIVLDEISLKKCVNYDVRKDELEGMDDFGHLGRTKCVANHALVFMARGLIQEAAIFILFV